MSSRLIEFWRIITYVVDIMKSFNSHLSDPFFLNLLQSNNCSYATHLDTKFCADRFDCLTIFHYFLPDSFPHRLIDDGLTSKVWISGKWHIVVFSTGAIS